MSEYRATATLNADGTFIVPAPKGLPIGTRAEVTVRVEETRSMPVFEGPDSIKAFYEWLESQPLRESTWETEQAMVRQIRNEWG